MNKSWRVRFIGVRCSVNGKDIKTSFVINETYPSRYIASIRAGQIKISNSLAYGQAKAVIGYW